LAHPTSVTTRPDSRDNDKSHAKQLRTYFIVPRATDTQPQCRYGRCGWRHGPADPAMPSGRLSTSGAVLVEPLRARAAPGCRMIRACFATFGKPWRVLCLLKCRNHLAGADTVGLSSPFLPHTSRAGLNGGTKKSIRRYRGAATSVLTHARASAAHVRELPHRQVTPPPALAGPSKSSGGKALLSKPEPRTGFLPIAVAAEAAVRGTGASSRALRSAAHDVRPGHRVLHKMI